MASDIVKVAVGINMIWDIVDRIHTETGVRITPENLSQYAAERERHRRGLNQALGIAADTQNAVDAG